MLLIADTSPIISLLLIKKFNLVEFWYDHPRAILQKLLPAQSTALTI